MPVGHEPTRADKDNTQSADSYLFGIHTVSTVTEDIETTQLNTVGASELLGAWCFSDGERKERKRYIVKLSLLERRDRQTQTQILMPSAM